MGDYDSHTQTEVNTQTIIPKESAIQSLNTIIQLHFEKTLEKKRAVDLQKKQLWKLFQLFFLFLSLIFASLSISTRLQCRHCWIPIALLSFSHLIFYVSVAQTLRCINALKYQRRCHKLTLGLATQKLRDLNNVIIHDNHNNAHDAAFVNGEEFEIHYQEPPESYFGKFKRNWALYFGFLILLYAFMVSSSVVLLCF
ncbi:hypothetical protein BVRB_6g133270 [Beta vulgaris subsp. vulgaris]|uniref:uncharacterized protein LOC104895467 n=1 Tax=Beta vulgaris subsp. vulgaris TaxID=3555 RepID=UPI00053FF3E6|nr:uncharacterized protein LOC104895467 [Beta vulgaris subsp. vulgaris]KMT09225.1 hypothetical protein BVRB_6g133270 [Beta vulgaris subsp. vulgaris]